VGVGPGRFRHGRLPQGHENGEFGGGCGFPLARSVGGGQIHPPWLGPELPLRDPVPFSPGFCAIAVVWSDLQRVRERACSGGCSVRGLLEALRGVGGCEVSSVGAGSVVGWATGASSNPGPHLPAICPPPCSDCLGGAGRICVLLAGLAGSGGAQTLRRASPGFSWLAFLGAAPRWGCCRPCDASYLLGRVGSSAAAVWRIHEVRAKAWTTTSVDAVCLLPC
jgi:hypothetical protein